MYLHTSGLLCSDINKVIKMQNYMFGVLVTLHRNVLSELKGLVGECHIDVLRHNKT